MTNLLKCYTNQGKFIFRREDNLETVCNAPVDKCGIYLFYSISQDKNELLYIGCSGHIKNDGVLSVRKSGCGGIKGRIVNGHQFGKLQRCRALPVQMAKDNINTLEIHWYVTYDNYVTHSPIYVESCLLQHYYDQNRRLPKWNLKF